VILTLEITSSSSSSSLDGSESRQMFDAAGGSLGRDTDNSWVLPHPKVSAHHAVITCQGGVFYIEDRSTNGVCVNTTRNRLTRNRPYALKSGDYLLIEPYEIRVSVSRDDRDAAGHFAGAADPFGNEDPFGESLEPSGRPFPPPDLGGETVDPLKLLGASPKEQGWHAPPNPRAKDLDRASPMEEHFQPPAAIHDPAMPPPSAVTIPEGYDPLTPDDPPFVSPRPAQPSRPIRSAPTPPPIAIPADYNPLADESPSVEEFSPAPESPVVLPPAPPPVQRPPAPPSVRRPPEMPAPRRQPERPPASADLPGAASSPDAAEFSDVLAGAGLDPAIVTPEVARDFGRMLRAVVAGLMDVLRARQQIKDEFRMQMTRFRPTENNPLKFSANVDDALHNLLVKRNPAYLPAVDAFEDAFTDLRNHQIAMLAGMRVAFESMLAEFDPDRLQQDFDRQLNKGLMPAKLRYWELYREKREEIVKDPETAFRRLFGEEFARAYEDQLRQLKAQESSARDASGRPPKRLDT